MTDESTVEDADEIARRRAASAFPLLLKGDDDGEAEYAPAKLRILFGYLKTISKDDIDPREVLRHAVDLHFSASHLAAGVGRFSAHKIGFDKARGFYADPARGKGPSAELVRLQRAAKSGSLKRWLTAWAATGDATRSRVCAQLKEDQHLRRSPRLWVSFSAPSSVIGDPPHLDVVINAPRANIALPAIAAAIHSLQMVPAKQRKSGRKDARDDEFISKLFAAYSAVTDRRPTLTWDPYRSCWSGRTVCLAHKVDGIYSTCIASKVVYDLKQRK
jgi:hypothetical protein